MMATFVTLTDYWSVHRGARIPVEVVVNLDLVKTIQRLPAVPAVAASSLAERTQLWFGDSGTGDSESVLVTETLDDILEAARQAAEGEP